MSMPDVVRSPIPRHPAERVTGETITGDVRIHRAFPSQILGNSRDIWVYLPPGYQPESSRTYPVLYVHDGNNLFDARVAFGGREWGLDETVEALVKEGKVEPTVIVGAANTEGRMNEYTWVPDRVHGGGGGVAYANFLLTELMPFIDATYRVSTERERTGVLGSSLGGLCSLYLGAHAGRRFGLVGAMSPSLWWADRQVLRDFRHVRPGLRIWLDMGAAEGRDADQSRAYVEDARQLAQVLVGNGYTHGKDLMYWEAADGRHDEHAWGERAHEAIQFLLAR